MNGQNNWRRIKKKRGRKPLWGCSKDKLNIKGQKLNIYGLPAAKIIDHSVASQAYRPSKNGILLLYLWQLNLAEGVI